MKILLLTNHLNIGGISSYCLALSKGLCARGHTVYIASSGGEMVSLLEKEGAVFVRIPVNTKAEIGLKVLRSLIGLRRFVKTHPIDIVHANTRVTQVLASLLEKSTGVPYISTCHGFFKRRFLRRIFPCWGKKVIAISEQVKEHLEKDFGVANDQIEIIHNGIDLERFSGKTLEATILKRKQFGLGNDPVVGIVARLSDVKGHEYLLRAWPLVLKHVPSARLLIAGEGKMEKKLRGVCSSLGISQQVLFISTVSDTRDVLWALDVFVLPSLNEGLGLALMEAMACGLGVIGSNVGGIRTLIQHGKNGLLVEPADVQGLADAIVLLICDKNLRVLYAQEGQRFIRENFGLEKMALEMERGYAACLNA